MSERQLSMSTVVLDDETRFTLVEVCRACGISADTVIAMAEEGLVEVEGPHPGDWRFPGTALRRIRTALRLQEELEVNLAGAVLALDLLDEVDRLNRRVRTLEQLLWE